MQAIALKKMINTNFFISLLCCCRGQLWWTKRKDKASYIASRFSPAEQDSADARRVTKARIELGQSTGRIFLILSRKILAITPYLSATHFERLDRKSTRLNSSH